jgi:RNA polymerase sigma-70 factor, ECF subfamily
MASRTVIAEDSDSSLVAKMAAGDEAALSELYDRHRVLLFSLALRVLRDRAEAEEILHDVFLQAWRGAGGYDPGRGAVPAWLITLTRSRAIDRLRSRARRDVAMAAAAGELSPARSAAPPAEDPAERLETLAKRRRIESALRALSPQQRDAIELAYYGGLSHTEVAAKLGEPLGTVKTRIRQALMTLRERLVRGFDAV